MTTEDFNLYEDSTITWAIRVEDEDPADTFTPVDLTGATITADIDNGAGTKIAEWSTTIPTQTGEDVGWVELELSPTNRTAILVQGNNRLYYDVRAVLPTGEILYPITRSTIDVARAVTNP